MAYNMQNVVGTANAVGTTETTIAALPATNYFPSGQYSGMAINGVVSITNGTALTAVLRVRNGATTAGTTIGSPMTLTTVSGGLMNIPFQVVDTSAAPTTSYNVTIAGGAGASTIVTNAISFTADPVLY